MPGSNGSWKWQLGPKEGPRHHRWRGQPPISGTKGLQGRDASAGVPLGAVSTLVTLFGRD
jgi:hypothetical protein